MAPARMASRRHTGVAKARVVGLEGISDEAGMEGGFGQAIVATRKWGEQRFPHVVLEVASNGEAPWLGSCAYPESPTEGNIQMTEG